MLPKGDLQLSIGYWIVSHKQTLKTWWAISLMFIITGTLLWMVLFFVLTFSLEGKMNNFIISSADGAASFTTTTFQPQPLTIGKVTVIARDDTHVDLVAELSNPNPDWAAQVVTVRFTLNGVDQKPLQLFVNQRESRPVIQFNAPVKTSIAATATMTVDDTDWTRSTATTLPAAVFSVANIITSPSVVTINGQTRTSVSVTAEITNSSVYNFYHVDLPIVLSNGDQVVGVGLVGIDRWPTLTMRPVTLTLTYSVGSITEVRIDPQVSRFDLGNTYR